tara:strand:- start:320 stop:1201 length:882 start_codon:yes stop_codon:yes gene_type:complete
MEERRDIQKIYFDEAAEAPLLSRKEEAELVDRLMRWSKNKAKCGSHTRKKGKEAKQRLILSNLRLVIKIAQKYENMGLDIMDLISEGNIGLVQSVERFDPNKGVKFSTYAAIWIKQHIRRALGNQSRTIRIPIPVYDEKSKILKYKANFNKRHNREPSFDEIRKRFKFPKEKLTRLLQCGGPPTSINMKVGDEGETTLESILVDSSSKNPYEKADSKDLSETFKVILNKLTSREKYIIMRRFGMNDYDQETLESIGDDYKISRERVRQIETQALRKIRFHAKKLLDVKLEISS